jgi:hypothetical protein
MRTVSRAKTRMLAQENCAIGKRVKILFMAELKFGPAEKPQESKKKESPERILRAVRGCGRKAAR